MLNILCNQKSKIIKIILKKLYNYIITENFI